LIDHALRHGLHQEEHPLHVDREELVERFPGLVEQRAHVEDRRIVEQDVDAAEALHGLRHDASDVLALRDVGPHEVNVLLLRKSIVLPPVPYVPFVATAPFCTSAPD
jgi:hypothetical protein